MDHGKMRQKGRYGSESNLPRTRFELLLDAMRFHSFSFLGLSALCALFFLPSWGFLLYATLNDFLNVTSLPSVALVFSINAALFSIGGLGMAGIFNFSKKLAFEEGSSLLPDFFEGIKKDGLPFMGVFFLIGILYDLLRIDITSLIYGLSLTGWALGMSEGVSYAIFFLLVLSLLFTLPEIILYTGSFFSLWKNGIIFLFGAFLTNIPIYLSFMVPFLIFEFVPYFEAQIAMMAFEAIYYFAFSSFFFTIYSYSLFDKSINKKSFPSLVRKGLSPIAVDKEKDN